MPERDGPPLDAQIPVLHAYVTDLLAQAEAAGRATERVRTLVSGSGGHSRSELAAALARLDRIAGAVCERAADLKDLTARAAARVPQPAPGGSTGTPQA
jgi:hypothetical protein